MAKFGLGDYEGAVRWERLAVEANLNYAPVYFQLAAALAQLNRLDEAHSAVEAGLKLNPAFLHLPLARRGSDERRSKISGLSRAIYDALRKAGVPEQ